MSSKATASGRRTHESDDLNSYFDRSANAVKEYADVLEHNYARPALRLGSIYYDHHPIISVFLVILFCLSFVPVITFIGFSIFAGVSLAIIAVSCALGAFLFVELLFVSILLSVLFAVVCMSIFLTGATIFTYLFIRLVTLVRLEGSLGFKLWMLETKGRYAPNRDHPSPTERSGHRPSYYEDGERHGIQADASPGSESEAVPSKGKEQRESQADASSGLETTSEDVSPKEEDKEEDTPRIPQTKEEL